MAFVLLVLFLFSTSAGIRVVNFRSAAAAYLLPGNKTDYCYDKPYISNRAECVERLVTLYYGYGFPAFCPNSVYILAREKCKGCPWDKINVNAITPAISRKLNRSELFHPPAPSCSLAGYLDDTFSSDRFLYLSFFGFAIPMFSAMFLAKIDANGSPTTPLVFGSRLKEPIYFVFLWLLFFVGLGMSSAGHEAYDFCHDSLSLVSLAIGDWINFAVMLWTSLWRCRYLEAQDQSQEIRSWALYRGSVRYRASSVWSRRLVDSACGAGPALIILSVVFNKKFKKVLQPSGCHVGSYESISYGLIEYSKIMIGTLAVGFYSVGPPLSPVLFYIRYSVLAFIMLVSVCFLFVMCLPVYEPQCLSKLIAHVTDCEISGPLHAGLAAHSFAVALLGVAEPLRLGWPKRRTLKCDAKDIMCSEQT